VEKIVLFDGVDASHFTHLDGTPIKWIVEDGAMKIVPRTGNIVSDVRFKDAHIYVEWKEPVTLNPRKNQHKGNSGVYLQGRYELQVLDSYGEEDPKNNDCAAFYEMYAPLVNACKPPLEWQEYDIYFRAPRFNEDGTVKEFARVTVVQNGICVQNNIELYRATPGGIDMDILEDGPLMLQDHHHNVWFRNVYIEKY
jgi:hypothetical protein